MFLTNKDWDPQYLRGIVTQDFYDFKELWQSNVCDCNLVCEVNKVDKYCPIVEDIYMDDDTLYEAVEQIESP